jgi:NADPH2:quinone reductase
MKAVLCKAFGPADTLVVEDVSDPAPGAGEVVVSVKAAGVNFPDVLMIENKYQVKPPLPFSPGGEAAGVVSQVGAGVVGLKTGDRVMAITGHGAFAEKVVVSADRLVAIPAGMDDVTAGAFLFTYATSDHAVRDRGALRAGEIGKAVGATVIACASTDDKLAVCREHGADDAINYATEDLRDGIKRITGDRGVDVVIDPVGGRFSEPAFRSTTWRGRFVVVGFAAGDIPKIPLNLALLKGSSIVGSSLGGWMRREPERFAESTRQLLRWHTDGRLKPHIDRTFPLERAGEAIAYMAGRQVKGKVVVTTG